MFGKHGWPCASQLPEIPVEVNEVTQVKTHRVATESLFEHPVAIALQLWAQGRRAQLAQGRRRVENLLYTHDNLLSLPRSSRRIGDCHRAILCAVILVRGG